MVDRALITGHRTDIEGLRAVAVVAVLLYHAEIPGFSGGFVGVDVFFVVSGYLMTALLVTERFQKGSIDLPSFYARRIRRLLPASGTVLLATLIAAWLILPALSFNRLSREVAASGGYVANMFFASQATDYLGGEVDASPVLHYWSLAVEEQFYLVWPVLLGLAVGRAGRRSLVLLTLSGMAVLSFSLSVIWTAAIQPWSFFSLPTRAWEFAVGGIAAFVGAHHRFLGRFSGSAGLALIGLAIFTFDAATRFPGPWAAVPVIGTALVLASGESAIGWGLSNRLFQWIGRHSYGLYLWHWPPLVLIPRAIGRPLELVERLGVLGWSVVAASAALRWIENPIRYSRAIAQTPRRGLFLGATLTVMAVAIPIAWGDQVLSSISTVEPGLNDGSPSEFDLNSIDLDAVEPRPAPADLSPSLAEVTEDTPGDLYSSGCHAPPRATSPVAGCFYGDIDSGETIVLFGDSHMAQWFPAFEAVGAANGIRIVSITKSACPSVTLTLYTSLFQREYTECDAWRLAALEQIGALQPDSVVLANYPATSTGFADSPDQQFDSLWIEGLRTTIEGLQSIGVQHVVVLGATPVPRFDVPECVSGALADTSDCDLVRSDAVDDGRARSMQVLADSLGSSYLEPISWFCGEKICPSVIGSYLVYRDSSHVTTSYMSTLSARLFDSWVALGLPSGGSQQ